MWLREEFRGKRFSELTHAIFYFVELNVSTPFDKAAAGISYCRAQVR